MGRKLDIWLKFRLLAQEEDAEPRNSCYTLHSRLPRIGSSTGGTAAAVVKLVNEIHSMS